MAPAKTSIIPVRVCAAAGAFLFLHDHRFTLKSNRSYFHSFGDVVAPVNLLLDGLPLILTVFSEERPANAVFHLQDSTNFDASTLRSHWITNVKPSRDDLS